MFERQLFVGIVFILAFLDANEAFEGDGLRIKVCEGQIKSSEDYSIKQSVYILYDLFYRIITICFSHFSQRSGQVPKESR